MLVIHSLDLGTILWWAVLVGVVTVVADVGVIKNGMICVGGGFGKILLLCW